MAIQNFSERRQALCDWLTANSINPNHVPEDADLTIDTGPDGARTIRYKTFVFDENGRITADARGYRAAIETRSAPLAVEPPEWWQPFEKPAREQLLVAVERVRAQHTCVPVNDERYECYECSRRDHPDYSVPWPCPTIRALNGEGP